MVGGVIESFLDGVFLGFGVVVVVDFVEDY